MITSRQILLGRRRRAALTRNLIAFWEFENANDSHAAYHWTAYNVPTYVAGLVGNGVQTVNTSSQYLDQPVAAALTPTGDFEWMTFVKFDLLGADRMLFNVGDANSGSYPHTMAYELMYVNSGTKFRFAVGNGTTSVLLSSTFSPIVTATWYGISAYHRAGSTVGLAVNNAAHETSAWAGGSYQPALGLTAAKWCNFAGAFGRQVQDSTGFWGRVLAGMERTWFYNSGAGRTYAEVSSYSMRDIALDLFLAPLRGRGLDIRNLTRKLGMPQVPAKRRAAAHGC